MLQPPHTKVRAARLHPGYRCKEDLANFGQLVIVLVLVGGKLHRLSGKSAFDKNRLAVEMGDTAALLIEGLHIYWPA